AGLVCILRCHCPQFLVLRKRPLVTPHEGPSPPERIPGRARIGTCGASGPTAIGTRGGAALPADARLRLAAYGSGRSRQPQGPPRVSAPSSFPPQDPDGQRVWLGGHSMTAAKPQLTIYTDGACSGTPGPGGWGAVLISGPHRKEICGGEPQTTNNRMELAAAIAALDALKKPSRVDLHSDSEYLRNGISTWIEGWKRNGWRTSAKQPVKNVELWQRLDGARERHQGNWHWVAGPGRRTE